MIISIIEDSLVDRKIVSNHLQHLGYKSLIYDTTSSFIDDNNPGDLLLLDVNMSPINGVEYLKGLRKKSQKPVVLTTGLESFDPLILECCSYKNVSFIQKPITKDKLMPMLKYYSKRNIELLKNITKKYKINNYSNLEWRPPSGKTSGATNGIEYRNFQRLL